MDVLTILQNGGKELLSEELDMLSAELDTGAYDAGYVVQCKKLIAEIKNWHNSTETVEQPEKKSTSSVILNPDELVPKGAVGIPTPPPILPEKKVNSDLQRMRTEKDYKTAFKKYMKASSIIDEAFVVNHFSLFKDWERDAMLACIPFSEAYLEQYFDILDPKMIALYQLFSEDFFMRHYSELDTETVLSKGVNPWRDKSVRSKQLEVFLRIKGVKL